MCGEERRREETRRESRRGEMGCHREVRRGEVRAGGREEGLEVRRKHNEPHTEDVGNSQKPIYESRNCPQVLLGPWDKSRNNIGWVHFPSYC